MDLGDLRPEQLRLDWLASFVVFAEECNFTRAAERLYLSQPALHTQIRRLGETVGVVLYGRSGRRLELTAEGRRLEAFARELLERLAELPAELAAVEPAERVVLCAGEGAFLYVLGEGVKRFRRRPAGARLHLQTGNRERTIEEVAAGRAHLGVTVFDGQPPSALGAELLASFPHTVLMPSDHRLARRRSLSVSDLRDEPLVLPAADRPLRAAVDRALAEHEVVPQVAVECHGWPLLSHFAALGLGLAVVNGCCAAPRGLRAVRLRDLPEVRYWLFARPGRLAPAAERLRDDLRTACALRAQRA